jgi:hypothetical protein
MMLSRRSSSGPGSDVRAAEIVRTRHNDYTSPENVTSIAGITDQIHERCFYTIPAVSTTRFHVAFLTGTRSFMTARIFKPAKNAMQSGTAKTKEWQLDYEPEQPRSIEPLMGWTSSGDMKQQLSLHFHTKEEAIAYCEREGIPYQVFEPKEPARRQAAYADNFAFRRGEPWTH